MSLLKTTTYCSLLFLLIVSLTFKGSLGQYNKADRNNSTADIPKVILVSDISDTIITVMKDNYIPAVNSQEKETEFFRLWEHLGALKSLKERMESLYTLTEVRERAQLLAIQTVSEKVMDTACQLMEADYNIRNCSYDSLQQLKLEIDIHNTLKSMSTSAKAMVTDQDSTYVYKRQNYPLLLDMLLDMVKCLLSPATCKF